MQITEHRSPISRRRPSIVPWVAAGAVCAVLALSIVHVLNERSRIQKTRARADSMMSFITTCRMGESEDQLYSRVKRAEWFRTADVKHYQIDSVHLRAVSATWAHRTHQFRATFLKGRLTAAVEMASFRLGAKEDSVVRLRELSMFSPERPCGYITSGDEMIPDPDLPCKGAGF